MSSHKPWVDLSSRYGANGEYAAWSVVQEDYYWDRIEPAYDAAKSLGSGSMGVGMTTFRLIEAEWVTRQVSEIREVNEWLQIEWVPDDADMPFSAIAAEAVRSCEKVCYDFGYKDRPKVLITLLARTANTPWAPGRHGFCMDKYPYEKVCIPSALTRDIADMDEVIRHEYAHVMNMNRSNGLCPIWLDEAAAMTAGGDLQRESLEKFASGEWPWVDPVTLSQGFQQNRESKDGREIVWRAYQQSAAIGEYLRLLQGLEGIGRLMDGYANNSLIVDLFIRLKGEEPTEEALNEVYDFGIEALFHRCLEQIKN